MKVQFSALVLALLWPAAWAAPITYSSNLSGLNEAPPNASAGTGLALVTIDTVAHTLSVDVSFSGLSGLVTASHIHCCTASPLTGTAGVATMVPTFLGFPSGVTSGSYSHTFDLTMTPSFNPAFVTLHGGSLSSAETDLAAGMAAGRAYLNIHTNAFPGGEIRGFLTPVPEPGTFVLAAAVLLVPILRRRRT